MRVASTGSLPPELALQRDLHLFDGGELAVKMTYQCLEDTEVSGRVMLPGAVMMSFRFGLILRVHAQVLKTPVK